MAAAALLVEAAHLDAQYGDAERDTIRRVLTTRFSLSPSDADAIVSAGEDAQGQAVELYGFTKRIKDAMPPEERVAIIEMLWEVAYADGELHDYEAHLVRKVAGLIYVTDRDRGEARKRVVQRLGMADAPEEPGA
ncbi:MAG: TerB family tellurite resistance protein [Alphaproteobacteria bacterium]